MNLQSVDAIVLIDLTDNRFQVIKFEIIHLDCILHNAQGMLLKNQ